MISRSYDKKIQIFEILEIEDGFGGFTTEHLLIYSVWSNIKTQKSQSITDVGVKNSFNNTIFTIRNRPFDIKNSFVKYKGISYAINTIDNLNLLDVDLVLNCYEYPNQNVSTMTFLGTGFGLEILQDGNGNLISI